MSVVEDDEGRTCLLWKMMEGRNCGWQNVEGRGCLCMVDTKTISSVDGDQKHLQMIARPQDALLIPGLGLPPSRS